MKRFFKTGIGQDFQLESYLKIFFWVLFIALINHQLNDYLGYRATGFIFLMFVTVCGLFFSFGPVFLAATLSALTWNYFFIPPKGTFIIHSPEDAMMFATYFVTASVSGFLTFQIKKNQIILQNREENTRSLYEVLKSMTDEARQAALLKESEKLHQTLLNCISHELRTPLTAIMGAATALPIDQSNHLLVTEIVSASEQLNQVFENLLDMTRIESGVIKPNLEWFDVLELVQYVIELKKNFLSQHKIDFHPQAQPIYCLGDFNLLAHVLANVLLNSISYTPVKSRITLTVEQASNEIHVRCKDEGLGIPPDQMPHLFDKFFRLPGTPTGGLGLGLSIAKNLIELHHGRISAANNSLCGTTFTITLPYEEPPAEVQEISA